MGCLNGKEGRLNVFGTLLWSTMQDCYPSPTHFGSNLLGKTTGVLIYEENLLKTPKISRLFCEQPSAQYQNSVVLESFHPDCNPPQ